MRSPRLLATFALLAAPLLAACGSSYPCPQDSQVALSVRPDVSCPSVADVQKMITDNKPTDPTQAIDLSGTGIDPQMTICWYRVIASDTSTCNATSRAAARAQATGDVEWEMAGDFAAIVTCANGSDPALMAFDVDARGGDGGDGDCPAQANPIATPDGVELGGLFAEDVYPARTRCTYDVKISETCASGGSTPLFGLN